MSHINGQYHLDKEPLSKIYSSKPKQTFGDLVSKANFEKRVINQVQKKTGRVDPNALVYDKKPTQTVLNKRQNYIKSQRGY